MKVQVHVRDKQIDVQCGEGRQVGVIWSFVVR